MLASSNMLLTPVTQIEHQFMFGPKYYFWLRVQSVCRNFSFRMKFEIGGSRVQYVQYEQKKIPFRMAMADHKSKFMQKLHTWQ
jgi:hypothetical protein